MVYMCLFKSITSLIIIRKNKIYIYIRIYATSFCNSLYNYYTNYKIYENAFYIKKDSLINKVLIQYGYYNFSNNIKILW